MTHLPLPQAPLEVSAPQPFLTYACRAEHARLQPVARSFDTMVPMVRVPLGETRTPTYVTPIGTVQERDHLMYSVQNVRTRFGAILERPIARVELITPARRYGTRFSPIALFIGYERESDLEASFYVVEAGTADGRPEVLYLATRMDEELSYATGYHPTPLCSAEQTYRSRLRLASPGEPGELVVEAFHAGARMPHLRITARFERRAFDHVPVPLALTAEAALRVMTVARDLGADVAGPIGTALGALGATHLPWAEDDEPAPSSSAA